MEKKKKGTGIVKWSVSSAVLAVLLAAAVFGTNLAYESEQVINIALKINTTKIVDKGDGSENSTYFESDFATVEELEAHDKEVAEQLQGEGAVLLMNKEKALPLQGGGKISLFSRSCANIATCGTGSADIDTSSAPTLKEALEAEGFTVNPSLWDFYTKGAGKDYPSTPTKGMEGMQGGRESYHMNEVPVNKYTDEVKASFREYSDAAVIVLTRLSGEMFDMPTDGFVDGENALELTKEEQDMMKMVQDAGFDKIILLINSTNAVECDFLTQDTYGIDAALWIGYTGTYGLNAIADIISGAVNPSGRLVDTYCNDNTTAPSMVGFYGDTYGNAENNDAFYDVNSLDGNSKYIVYQEGIYVGYRYYETRYEDKVTGEGNTADYDYAADVAYPFGYGLSYTDFEWSDFKADFKESDDAFEVSVKVTNNGDAAGKEVVQVYFQSPFTEYDRQNGIEKAAVELCGFAKTQILEPGASETVTITVPREEFAAYDRNGAKTYILDEGDYYLTAADNAHAAVNNVLSAKGFGESDGMDGAGNKDFTFVYNNKKLDTQSFAKSSATGADITNQLEDGDLNYYGVDCDYLSRTDWQGTWPKAFEKLEANEQMMEGLTNYQTYQGEASEGLEMPAMGADNGLTLAMYIGKDYDDETWNDLLDQLTYEEMATLTGKTYHNTAAMETVSKPATADDNGPQGFTQTLTGVSTCHAAYSDENIMAATYNTQLMEEVGKALGNDMLDLKAAGLYGPAMNTHRNAYCGRNFEYYSEDGFLGGKIAAAEIKGIQSKGVYVYIKHYAFNDSETGCRCISTFLNEQAAREVFLKPFETAVTEGGAKCVMNAFARVGTTWSGAHKGLMTEILRGEWGLDGFVLTDFSGNSAFASYGIMLKSFDVAHGLLAGTNGWDSSAEQWTDDLMNLYQDDPAIAHALRESSHRVLYTVANSHAMNGLSSTATVQKIKPWWKTAIQVLDGLLAVLLLGSVVMLIRSILKKKAQ